MYVDVVDFPESEVVLAPLGDVQVGADYAKDTLRRFVDKATDKGARFIGMGDYVDVTNPSSRRALSGARLADTLWASMEAKAEEHIDEFCETIKSTQGRWVGLLGGHHFFPFRDGTTSDTRIAWSLGASYLGDSALLIIRTPFRDYRVLAFHGEGSSISPAGALRRLEGLAAGFNADLVLMAHHHKLAATKRDKLCYSGVGDEIGHETQTLVCTGSFVKGYIEGPGTYVERKMLPPVTLGGALVYLHRNGEIGVEL